MFAEKFLQIRDVIFDIFSMRRFSYLASFIVLIEIFSYISCLWPCQAQKYLSMIL